MISPLLIDSRGLLKLGFALTLTAIFIFGGGIFVGFQRANTIHYAVDDTQILILPEQVAVSENSIAAYPPEKIEVGEEIDVDEPESVPLSVSAPVLPVPNKHARAVVKTVETKQQSMAPSSANKHPESGDGETLPVVKVASKETGHDSEPGAVTKDVSVATKEKNNIKLSDIKYSVQVGVYGRLYNARNTVKTLKAQQFDAYISDYRNKKNEIRYNVRFGYFIDRKSARQRLKKFKKDRIGDGYLVKFSADNIVSAVNTVAIAPSTMLPAKEEKTSSNESISREVSLETSSQNQAEQTSTKNTADNISQAEIFPSDVLMKNVIKTN